MLNIHNGGSLRRTQYIAQESTSALERNHMATDTSYPHLSDADLQKILKLTSEADTVELKLTIPEDAAHSTVTALEIDLLDAYLRQVYFFDTPNLDLYENGLVVRARRSQDRPDDTVVKLRPVDPSDLPPKLREAEDFGVEVDAMPGGYVCSGSLKGEHKAGHVKETIAGGRSLDKLFSKAQRELYKSHAPEGIALNDLSTLGPINVAKVKFPVEGYPRKMVVEVWFYPDGSRIIELSTKCAAGEGFQVAAETRAFLLERGVDLDSKQETKTRAALDYFSRVLQGQSA
jgi:hypothetical protein